MLFRKNKNIIRLNELSHKILLFESESSFNNIQFDQVLFNKYFEGLDLPISITTSFLAFQKAGLAASFEEPWSILKEVAYMQHYLGLWKDLNKENFDYQLKIQVEDNQFFLQPFILMPLVQNSLYFGYHFMSKFPVKIDLRLIGNRLSLTVSNRVNHHINNQANTEIIKRFKSRLVLNYPNHQLLINSNSTLFKTNLMMELSNS